MVSVLTYYFSNQTRPTWTPLVFTLNGGSAVTPGTRDGWLIEVME
jgi:hypothetical protein